MIQLLIKRYLISSNCKYAYDILPFLIKEMLYSIMNIGDLENLNNLVSLENQVRAVRLQDKLGERNFLEDMKKVVGPVTNPNKDVSQDKRKTMTENYFRNNKALENLNEKLLEIRNGIGIIASYLLSHLSEIINPENTSQFKFVKVFNSNRVNYSLIHNTIPVFLYNNLLTFRDTDKKFELEADLLNMITNRNYKVDLASLSDKKILYDFAKAMSCDVKAQGKKFNRHTTLVKLLKSPGLVISASGISKTIFSPSDPNELCDRIKYLLQKNKLETNLTKLTKKPLL